RRAVRAPGRGPAALEVDPPARDGRGAPGSAHARGRTEGALRAVRAANAHERAGEAQRDHGRHPARSSRRGGYLPQRAGRDRGEAARAHAHAPGASPTKLARGSRDVPSEGARASPATQSTRTRGGQLMPKDKGYPGGGTLKSGKKRKGRK